jgi:hypothetical protein
MRGQVSTVDARLALIAGRAHGVASRGELLAAGLSADQIDRRVAAGSLIVEYRGIYLVGHRPPTAAARYMAAVKACGGRALLSGMAAAWLWDLVRGPAPQPEVTAPRGHRIPGITTKRRLRMSAKDSTKRQGIPVSTVPVTLIAISSVLSFDELARAVHEADVRHDVTGPHIKRALERHPKAKKRSRLLAIATGDAHLVLSRLERHFLTLLRRHRLPLPQTNRPYGAGYVDCRWPAHRLTVELDSYRFHRTRRAWEQDRQRERDARARGDEFRRYTWRDVVEEPAPTVAELALLLGSC